MSLPHSKLDDSNMAVWDSPDLSMCEKIMNDIEDLKEITVTPGKSHCVPEV